MSAARKKHWLDGGAMLIVLRDSPLDRIAHAAFAKSAELAVAGIPYLVVGNRPMPTDMQCARIHLQRNAGIFAMSANIPARPHSALEPITNSDFRNAMTALGLTLDDMAETLGIARRMVAYYRRDTPVPRHVALAVRHLVAIASPWPASP